MLPLTLGLLVISLFMRVGYSVCVTLPLIIFIIFHLPLYSQWSSSCFIHVMVMKLSKYTLHNLAIPWENINNGTLNTSG